MTTPLEVGAIIADKYRVEGTLGQGGMGYVLSARHLQLGERVAIKLLRPTVLAYPDVVARFLREGQMAARIRSEHVGRVFDIGSLSNGSPYMVMEFLDGRDLGHVLATEGPLPVELAVDYVLQAAEAVAEAHALGIVHRDLKPSNLVLTRRADGSACIKVIDFGISKVLQRGEPAAEGELTQSAMMMGSPLYMPPEQMRSARGVDGRADVWSFGCILYALTTGAPPFPGETVMGVYESILGGVPSLEGRRPDAPAGIDLVIRGALEKEVAERTPSLSEFAERLSPYASPLGRLSIERIRGTIGSASHRGPSVSSPPDEIGGAVAKSRGSRAGATAGSWEKDRAARSSPRRGGWVVAGAAAVLGIGLGATVYWLRATDPGSAAAPGGSIAPTSDAPGPASNGAASAAAVTVAPSAAMLASALPATPASSASSPSSVPVAPPPSAAPPKPPPPKPAPAQTPPPKGPPSKKTTGADLFGEPQ
jgi:eukaryotic-like serine/threonine-protein kinase